jgi:hypothetical protein
VFVAAGCGLVPGLGDVLARHAAGALDAVDEVHIARSGVAGEACADDLRRQRRARPLEWRDGGLVEPRPRGPELVWFPDPLGAAECHSVGAGVMAAARSVPEADAVTVRFGEPAPRLGRWRPRRTLDPGWGAVRVEVWGWRAGERAVVVYGIIDRTAVAAGTVLGVTAARLAGLLPTVELVRGVEAGVVALGELVEPASFLSELAYRGVKAAVFEGAHR